MARPRRHREEGEVVSVDPLAGGATRDATVVAIDPLADLAVLRTNDSLPISIAGLSATDSVAMSAAVVVTGVSEVDDPGRSYRCLDAAGEWAGGTMIDDQIPYGHLESRAIVPGMSGAPVRAQQTISLSASCRAATTRRTAGSSTPSG